MKHLIQRFIREQDGQDLVEYAFLLVFIALALVAAVTATGTNILDIFTTVNTGIAAS
jgi:Flp pilus assembly pilin Flp